MSHHGPHALASSPSPWRPLRIPIFRKLLIADLVSDIGTFMQSVGAAWLMTSLTASPLYIALIQTASALPFFLLALPAGAIGDIVDRRRLILATESWMLFIGVALAVATIAGIVTPLSLLLLTLSGGSNHVAYAAARRQGHGGFGHNIQQIDAYWGSHPGTPCHR